MENLKTIEKMTILTMLLGFIKRETDEADEKSNEKFLDELEEFMAKFHEPDEDKFFEEYVQLNSVIEQLEALQTLNDEGHYVDLSSYLVLPIDTLEHIKDVLEKA